MSNMPEFWEAAFQDKQEMWGMEPAKSALLARDIFVEHGVKSVLIPGIGYGRNAQVFLEEGMRVTGIEISQTAIDLASGHFGNSLKIHHGSVTDMPFDAEHYDGIFCYGLIYLLDQAERAKLIQDCRAQLTEHGVMIFTAITKQAHTYGQGTPAGKDRFEQFGGVNIFFYDMESIADEFKDAGYIEVKGVDEHFPFYCIICRNGPANAGG